MLTLASLAETGHKPRIKCQMVVKLVMPLISHNSKRLLLISTAFNLLGSLEDNDHRNCDWDIYFNGNCNPGKFDPKNAVYLSTVLSINQDLKQAWTTTAIIKQT